MDNPEVKKTTINVKSVEVEAWELAKTLANRHDESMGAFLSRAIYQVGRSDSGPRELPPRVTLETLDMGNPYRFSGNPPLDRIALLNAVTAHSQVTGKRIPGATTFAAEMIREARGLPPVQRKIAGPGRARPAAVGHENGEARE